MNMKVHKHKVYSLWHYSQMQNKGNNYMSIFKRLIDYTMVHSFSGALCSCTKEWTRSPWTDKQPFPEHILLSQISKLQKTIYGILPLYKKGRRQTDGYIEMYLSCILFYKNKEIRTYLHIFFLKIYFLLMSTNKI